MGVTGALMAYDYLRAGDEITSETHYRAARRLLSTFQYCGGPYIKIGQIFGQLQNLVPDEYLEVFEPMCMAAPETSFSDVRSILESEFGQPLEEIFAEFEQKPLASASLGQVHRARLHNSSETVAVKVQHQWIREQVPGDLRVI